MSRLFHATTPRRTPAMPHRPPLRHHQAAATTLPTAPPCHALRRQEQWNRGCRDPEKNRQAHRTPGCFTAAPCVKVAAGDERCAPRGAKAARLSERPVNNPIQTEDFKDNQTSRLEVACQPRGKPPELPHRPSARAVCGRIRLGRGLGQWYPGQTQSVTRK
jgi:hypothetical protein